MAERLQAPKGGCVSEENGERYEGGQFLPSTCLPKGQLAKVRKLAKREGNLAEIKSFGGVVKTRLAGSKVFQEVFRGKTEIAEMFAKTLVAERRKFYETQGLMPHPTITSGF